MSEEQGWGRVVDDLGGKVLGATTRMALSMPHHDDVEDLFAMYSDPRVTAGDHLLRHASIEQTRQIVTRRVAAWQRDGIGLWVLRTNGMDTTLGDLIGMGGCAVMGGRAWNLSFSLRPEHWGKGYAQEVAEAGIEQAKLLQPHLPITAVVAQGNSRSHRAVERTGLTRVWEGSDSHDTDQAARIVLYADRPLSDIEIDWLTG